MIVIYVYTYKEQLYLEFNLRGACVADGVPLALHALHHCTR